MTEILFYHLERTNLETVLPGLLEKSLSRGWRALVVTGSVEKMEALDSHLWTYRDESFLPHNVMGKSQTPQEEPVLLQHEKEMHAEHYQSPANKANLIFFVDGAVSDVENLKGFERCVTIFDGRDEEALTNARQFWKSIKEAGEAFDPTYWQQGDNGRWQQQGAGQKNNQSE